MNLQFYFVKLPQKKLRLGLGMVFKGKIFEFLKSKQIKFFLIIYHIRRFQCDRCNSLSDASLQNAFLALDSEPEKLIPKTVSSF